MKRSLIKDKKTYIATFDEEGVLDTVQCEGKAMSTKNAVVKSILTHADSIRAGNVPAGFKRG